MKLRNKPQEVEGSTDFRTAKGAEQRIYFLQLNDFQVYLVATDAATVTFL